MEGFRPALVAYKTSDSTTTASIHATFLTSPSTSHLQSLPELLHHPPWLLEQIIGDVIVCGEPLTGWGRNLVHSASKHPKELDATTWKRRCQQIGSGIICGRRCDIRSISGRYHISRAKECHSSLILALVSKYLGESERKVLAIFGFST